MSDQATELCRRLQGETLERIRAHRGSASVQVAQLLTLIEQHFLDPDLTVEALRRWCGQHDKNVSTRFAAELGLTPWSYILQARMELAGRMLASSKVMVWQVGLQVGYDSGHSFGRAFKRWSGGQTPTRFRQQAQMQMQLAGATLAAPVDLVRNTELHRALAGELPVEHANAIVAELRDLAGQVSDVYHAPSSRIEGLHAVEPVMARSLWQWIEHLPYEVQEAAIKSQAPAFRTAALFHVLCTESIEAGAADEVRGHRIVALALSCLPAVVERLGKDSMHIFARAHLVAGLAFRRSGELDEAAKNLGIAYRMLDHMGDDAHPVVVAELCLYQGLLEIDRDNFEMAEMLSSQGFSILETLAEKLLEQQATPDPVTPGGDDGPSRQAS